MQDHGRVRGGGTRGFTLLELMVTMAILAVLFGMGTGLFSNLGVSGRGVVGLVRSLLRATREQALRVSAPARVDLDAEQGVAIGYHFGDIGQWHFEQAPGGLWPSDEDAPPRGAGPLWGFDSGAAVEVQAEGANFEARGGAPGGYAAFRTGGRLRLPLVGRRAFQTDLGFGIGLSLRLPEGASGSLAQRDRMFSLQLDQRGALRGRVHLASTTEFAGEFPKPAGELALTTGPRVVLYGRWTRIELDFDGLAARLLVDGRVVAQEELSTRALLQVREGSDLEVGPLGEAFDLDDLTLRRLASIGPVELVEGLRFTELRGDSTPSTRISIHFTADGYLDPRKHLRPVRVGLREREGERDERQRKLVVSLLGAVQEVVE